MNKVKLYLSKLMHCTGISNLLFYIRCTLSKNKLIYVVNYHDTPQRLSANFEEQLKFYQKNFRNIDSNSLDEFFEESDVKSYSKPGIIISFDDGLASNMEVASPLLEKYGFTGWFFIPTGFVECNTKEQRIFLEANSIAFSKGTTAEQRLAMNWDEVKYLNKNHVIGCHTKSHCRLNADLENEIIVEEISASKIHLETVLGEPVNVFCWVGGEEWSYSHKASEEIKKNNYKYSFMTNCSPISSKTSKLQLNRFNVEFNYPICVIKFLLSGIMELYYFPKRQRINKLTK
ncbi:polysaccharide deacetylase family protein [Vibrio cyclitrophicus]